MNNSIRVYELAKELNTTSKRIVEKLSDVNIYKKNHMALIYPEELIKLYKYIGMPIEEKKFESNETFEDKDDAPEFKKPEFKKNKLSRFRPRIIRRTTTIKTDNVYEIETKNIRNYYDYYKEKVREDNNIVKKVHMVYSAIEMTRKKYGDFKKCEIHIHTPASHDYALHSNLRKSINDNNGEFHDSSLEDILKIVSDYDIYDMKDLYNNIDYFKSQEYSKALKDNNIPFNDFKEELSYMLLAHTLYDNKLHLAIVTDHNTTEGFKKLKYAAKDYYSSYDDNDTPKHFVNIFLGVEISCSDEKHVVGIFDETDIEKVEEFINEIISNKKDGTYYPSLYVIEKIFNLGGIGYIAHLNSSKLNGNKPYKQKLFNLPKMRVVGLTDCNAKQYQMERISKYINSQEKDFCFFHESDAHVIDDIGKKNTWIKFNEVNFKSIKKAIEDHGICIKTEEPCKSDKYIKGIVVDPGEDGFLKMNKKFSQKYSGNEFFTEFSQDLNCIIGGRGTGKSTLINIIDLCFSQQTDDVDLLNFISKNKEIIIVFFLEGTDYILRLIPQVERINDDGSIKYLNDAFDTPFYPKKDHFKLSKNWYEFYRVNNINDFKKIDGFKIINDFYRRGYSINELVRRIKNKTISEYIRSIVLYGLDYKKLSKEITNIKRTGDFELERYLSINLKNIQTFIDEQAKIINDSLIGFNDMHKNQLIITYKSGNSDVEEIIEMLEYSVKEGKKFIARTYLQWNEVIAYLRLIIKKIGYIKFLNLLINKKYLTLESHLKISDFIDEDKKTLSMIEGGFSDISQNNISQVYDEIKKKLVSNYGFLRKSILYWIQSGEEFSLKFNVNNKEAIKKSEVLFKDLHQLSMGQKVSALLSFVFDYGKYTLDNTPLIIDQPEDNLDNQYIYRNLIKSLRNIKNERQVIIVTHCSAIVTNADAEHVIVMDSDGKNGWLSESGYPSNEKITEHIINFMEGGVESLRNKIRKYCIFNDKLIKD